MNHTTIPINGNIHSPSLVARIAALLSSAISRVSALASKLLTILINRKAAPFIILAIAILAILFLGKNILGATSNKSGSSKIEVAGPSAQATLNKEFSFPITDAKDKELTRVKYRLETAELRDEIIVKGQRFSAIQGRTFLILTVKVTNDYDKAIEINTRDFVRLSLGNNQRDWLAPDIHNDPVNVRAQSTKTTRLGFPLNDTDKDLKLRVGEINGQKEIVPISF